MTTLIQSSEEEVEEPEAANCFREVEPEEKVAFKVSDEEEKGLRKERFEQLKSGLLYLEIYNSSVLNEAAPFDNSLFKVGFGKRKDYWQELLDKLTVCAKGLNAAGLASQQIGVVERACVLSTPDGWLGVVNPRVVGFSEKQVRVGESCWSFLAVAHGARWDRSQEVEIEFLDREGKYRREVFMGYMACIVQHEMDHLEGKLIIDNIKSRLEKGILRSKFRSRKRLWRKVGLLL